MASICASGDLKPVPGGSEYPKQTSEISNKNTPTNTIKPMAWTTTGSNNIQEDKWTSEEIEDMDIKEREQYVEGHFTAWTLLRDKEADDYYYKHFHEHFISGLIELPEQLKIWYEMSQEKKTEQQQQHQLHQQLKQQQQQQQHHQQQTIPAYSMHHHT